MEATLGPRPRCGYCNKLGHTRDVCFFLHGKPKNAHVAQNESTGNPTKQLFSLSEVDYNHFLPYQASKQTSPSIASVAQTRNPVACISQSATLGPWIMDSGASDHIFGRIPFSYLEDVQIRFMKNYGKVVFMLQLTPMNDEFSRVLHQQMEFFSSNPSADTLNRVRGEVGELRTIMVDNIEKILEKGDWIEILVDKTATMQDGALNFRKQSKRLHRALWMKNAKLLVLLTCLFVLFLYLIIAACCGGITLPSCRL